MHVPPPILLSKPGSNDTLAATTGPTTQILVFKSHTTTNRNQGFGEKWLNTITRPGKALDEPGISITEPGSKEVLQE